MDAQELQRLKELAEFWAGKYHSSIPAVRQGWREAWGELETFVCNLAERAVSPAEIVQSIDTPEFHEMMKDILDDNVMYVMQWPLCAEKVIAYIDASRAAAHAEGRRSALEELHPQWLKEKERADKAEADAALWAKRYSDALNAAARQAPDLSKLERLNIDADGDDIQEIPYPDGDFVRFADVLALLFSTAQPANAAKVEAKPLCYVRQADIDNPVGSAIWAYRIPGEEWVIPIYAPQPSDNLQQASTAQVEPAKEGVLEEAVESVECTSCGGRGRDSSEDNYGGDCPTCTGQGFVIAASATDYVPEYKTMTDHHGRVTGVQWVNAGDAPAVGAAQATPEGADLPPLNYEAERVAFEAANKYTGLDLTRECGEYANYHTHCACGGWQDRARLTATTAAEPVAQYRPKRPAGSPWHDVVKGQPCILPGDLYEVRTLYRAAPPQQVDTGGLPG